MNGWLGLPIDHVFLWLFACALAVTLLLWAAGVSFADRRGKHVSRRLAKIVDPSALPAETARRQVARQVSNEPPIIRLLEALVPENSAFAASLRRTGREISRGRFVASCIIVGLLAAALLPLTGIPLMLVAPLALIFGGFGPRLWVQRKVNRRQRAFLASFAEAIDLIVRGLKTGLPVMETIAAVGRDMADPIGVEFRTVSDAVRLGKPIDDALWEAADRIGVPDFNFFVISLGVQRQTGGNLAETLENLSDILRRRQQMRSKVRAMSSEARASAWIVGLLPFVVTGILQFVNPHYISALYTDPRGIALLVLGLVSEAMGVIVMGRMAKFEI